MSLEKTAPFSHSIKIAADLYFNFVRINETNCGYWECDHFASNTKRVHDASGFLSFFSAVKHYFAEAKDSPNVFLYAFVATNQEYKGLDPIASGPEMFWTVTVDEGCFSNHMGAQRFDVPHPHKNISVQGHAFCAQMTKMLHPKVTHMVYAPQPIMRHILWEALQSKGIHDALTIEAWEGLFKGYDSKLSTYKAQLSKSPNNPLVKAMISLYQIVSLQAQLGETIESKGNDLYYHLIDGSDLFLRGGLPKWFSENTENFGGVNNALTIIDLNKFASLWDAGDLGIEHHHDVLAAGVAAVDLAS